MKIYLILSIALFPTISLAKGKAKLSFKDFKSMCSMDGGSAYGEENAGGSANYTCSYDDGYEIYCDQNGKCGNNQGSGAGKLKVSDVFVHAAPSTSVGTAGKTK